MNRLHLSGITVAFDGFTLGPVDLDLRSGITAILGPNGSGKTTLLRSIVGLSSGAQGQALASGTWSGPSPIDLMQRQPEGLRACAFASDTDDLLFGELTLEQFWRFYVTVRERSFGENPTTLLARAYEYADRLALDPGSRRIRQFSLGMKRKTQLITGLMLAAPLFLVDEPQNGLDFIASQELRVIFRERADAGALILMSNHDLDSVARMADRIVILQSGQVVSVSEQEFAGSQECERFVSRYFS